MNLDDITRAAGAHHRRKRVGRGESSGHGKTCGRGTKGCQSRAGGLVRPLTEGGQMPTFRRVPKRGFNNVLFRREYEPVNLSDLEQHFGAGDKVNVAALSAKGLISGATSLVKVLGDGTVSKKLAVEAHAFSGTAKKGIEQAGGSVVVIEMADPAAKWRAKRNTVRATRKGGGQSRRPAAGGRAPAPQAPTGDATEGGRG